MENIKLDTSVQYLKGVGPKKRDALLKAFGTSREIANADVELLQTVPGINPTLAQTIYEFFKNNPIDEGIEE